jgi:hypothetical protein
MLAPGQTAVKVEFQDSGSGRQLTGFSQLPQPKAKKPEPEKKKQGSGRKPRLRK